MSDWQQSVAGAVERFETRFDRLKRRLSASTGRTGSPLIVPYRSYGTIDRLLVMGRVLSNTPAAAPGATDSVWQNLLSTYRRLESDEVPGARVQAQIGNVVAEAETDEEGYFRMWLEGVSEYTTPGWLGVDLRLREPLDDHGMDASTRAHVLVPANEAQFGVISDIDDTVMQSHATELLRMAKLTFLGNAYTRLPFPGVAAFYRALVGSGPVENPIAYVSSSPWNLYDLIVDFFELQEIPPGPMFLRDWGITTEELLPTEHSRHKLLAIETLFEFYGDLPFILIGDSGQQDPEIYAEIVRRYADRVLAVYVRDVSEDRRREHAILELTKEVIESGSSLILAEDTLQMAQHGADNGWIQREALREIQREIEADIEGEENSN